MNEAEMKQDYNNHQFKKRDEQSERQAQIQWEAEELNNIQKQLAYEKQQKLA